MSLTYGYIISVKCVTMFSSVFATVFFLRLNQSSYLCFFLLHDQILQRLSTRLSASLAHLELLSIASSPHQPASLPSLLIAYYCLLNKPPWTDSLPPVSVFWVQTINQNITLRFYTAVTPLVFFIESTPLVK